MASRPFSVYRFFNAKGKLLYVGMTADLPARMRQHAKDKSWWGEVAKTTSEVHPTEKAAAVAEATAIVAEKPLYNIAGSGVDIEALKDALHLRERWSTAAAGRVALRGASCFSRNLAMFLRIAAGLSWAAWFVPLTYGFAQWTHMGLPLAFTTGFAACALLSVFRSPTNSLLLVSCSIPGSLDRLHEVGELTAGTTWQLPALRVATTALLGLVLLWTIRWTRPGHGKRLAEVNP